MLCNFISPTFFRILIVSTTLFLGACGGGSGGGDGASGGSDAITFQGSFSRIVSARVAGEKQNILFPTVTVSALGQSSTTDVDGLWSFQVPAVDVASVSGEVLFNIQGDGTDASIVVGGIALDSTEVTIAFQQTVDGSLVVAGFDQNGNLVGSGPIDPNLDDIDPSAAERACALLNQTRIDIIDSVQEVTSDRTTCPLPIEGIVSVVNTGSVSFEYEVTVDFGDITVAPLGGSLQPGESAVHNGAYRCESMESFDTSINVRVTRIFDTDGQSFTDADLLALCDDSFSIDAIGESSPIQVNITN